MRLALGFPTLLVLLLTPAVQAGEGARARAARLPCPQDAPEGVRLPDRPDCAGRLSPPARGDDGFREIGGVRLRIGGRVSAEYGVAR
ncbi:hypothetical protein PMNALOAF_3052 [Methylobacterium adhaesivum]|uniref:Porin n=1 Tax=Methylobacterium adhaesivum TaxID=333297 RepID=A0ABT8BLT4_9HYPH|nr:hypothetical protein [Methylobacterium adhaesivum]MDN3592275.1 hypothetical protein [Methylobacterium adhaesivum]GJD31789.1 hypothetical protein PMNALOAF_3052 [Methylobacterium adhaesivum]